MAEPERDTADSARADDQALLMAVRAVTRLCWAAGAVLLLLPLMVLALCHLWAFAAAVAVLVAALAAAVVRLSHSSGE